MSESTQEIVLIENARLSYAYLFEPYRGKNDAGKETASYGTHALLPPDHPALPLIRAAQRKVAAAAWQGDAENVLTQLAAQDRLCLHNGDISKAGQEAYKGHFYVSANGKVRPQIVVTRNGVNVAIEKNDPSAPYSGCWANVFIAIYAQGPNGKPSQYGKRINAQLMGVQFLRHDTAFGGGGKVVAPNEFPTVKGADADGAAPAAATGAAAGLF